VFFWNQRVTGIGDGKILIPDILPLKYLESITCGDRTVLIANPAEKAKGCALRSLFV